MSKLGGNEEMDCLDVFALFQPNKRTRLASQKAKKSSKITIRNEPTNLHFFYSLKMDFLLERLPQVSLEEMKEFGWSEEGRSPNMLLGRIHDDPLRVQRNSTPNSTDGIRGQKAMLSGLHIWEVRWPKGQRGTYSAIGVGTAEAAMQADGYCPLLGQDEHSFGWDIVARKCRHAGQEWDYPEGRRAVTTKKQLPDRIYAILDCQKGTLAFATLNDGHLGVAFRNLDGLRLFPMVATVFGQAQISLRYRGSPTSVEHCDDEIEDQVTEMPSTNFSVQPTKRVAFRLPSPLIVDFL